MARLDPPLAPFDARSPAHPPRGALSCPARIFLALNLSSQPRPSLTHRRSVWHQLVQQREALGPEFIDERVKARQVASRPIQATNEPKLHGVIADKEHDWDAGSC